MTTDTSMKNDLFLSSTTTMGWGKPLVTINDNGALTGGNLGIALNTYEDIVVRKNDPSLNR
jgi:hypothetical protein